MREWCESESGVRVYGSDVKNERGVKESCESKSGVRE